MKKVIVEINRLDEHLAENERRETFCVLYKRSDHPRAALKLSTTHETLKHAILTAYLLQQSGSAPLLVRGSKGTILEKEQLDGILAKVRSSL